MQPRMRVCIHVKGSKMAVGGAEEHFAKKLANNDKTIRDRAVKRLRAWIASRPSTGTGFSEIELLKVWKGLFYCFWMSDKPLIQEELAENISKLQHSFKNKESGFAFITTFFKTMHKEWHGIDRLRLDKFYLLMRMFIKENFEVLKNNSWDPSICSKLCDIYKDGPLHPSKENVPDGIKLHLCAVVLTELSSVAGEKVSAEIISLLLEPFFILAAQTKSQVVSRAVKEGVLEKLLEMAEKRLRPEDSDGDEEDDNQDEKEIMLQINSQAVADKLFSLGSDRQILGRNRKLLYLFSKKFKEAVSDTDKNEKERKGKKRKLENKNEELPNEEIPVKKPKKKKQEKQQLNGIVNSEEVDKVEKEPVKEKDAKKRKQEKQQLNGIVNSEEVDEVEKEPKVKKKDAKKRKQEKQQLNGIVNSEEVDKVEKEPVKKKDAKKKKQEKQQINDTVNSEEVGKVDQEPEVKKTDGKKKKQKRSQTDSEQDASEKGGPVTPKMKKKKSKEMLDINGNSEDEIIAKESNVKSSSVVQEEVPSQWINAISETVVEKTIKELRNQVAAETMEETPIKKKKKQGVKDNGTPFAAFTKTATPPAFFKKALSRTELRKAKTRKLTCPDTDPRNSKKKVTIHLNKNEAQSTADYVKSVTSSPAIPFDAGRTPEFGLLKTKPLTRLKSMRASKKHTPSKRSKAVDFF